MLRSVYKWYNKRIVKTKMVGLKLRARAHSLVKREPLRLTKSREMVMLRRCQICFFFRPKSVSKLQRLLNDTFTPIVPTHQPNHALMGHKKPLMGLKTLFDSFQILPQNRSSVAILGFNTTMRTRRQIMLEDRRRKLLKDRRVISVKGGINGDLIPDDLLIEILSRLSAKSIATCRCVSKLWSTILGCTGFTEAFLAKSAALPKLLLVCQLDADSFIISTPQLHNSSASTLADHLMAFPYDNRYSKVSYVNGLLCFETMGFSGGRKSTVLVICNPTTAQSLTLPRVKTSRLEVMSFFGYDPIDKRFKLLSMTRPGYGQYEDRNVRCGEHQVMTLGGNGKLLWRMIQCTTPHYPLSVGICINGALYYLAQVKRIEWNGELACFHIRSEKFEFIQIPNEATGKLVNYKGKLATLDPDSCPSVHGKTRSFKLCVLEDAEKHEWTTHTYVLPPLWEDIVGDVMLYIIGVTRTGEIVFSPYVCHLVYFIYYNLETNTVTKVEIQGMGEVKWVPGYMFLDHVDDVKLGGVFRKS